MILERLSPTAHRLLAVGIAVALLLGAINLILIPIASAVRSSLSDMEDARFRLSRLEAILQRPAPAAGEPIPPSLYIRAATKRQATEQMAETIKQAAHRNQIEVETLSVASPGKGRERIIDVPLAVRGPQERLIPFITEIERGQPQMRWSGWALTIEDAPPGDAASTVRLRLSGTASAVWEPGA